MRFIIRFHSSPCLGDNTSFSWERQGEHQTVGRCKFASKSTHFQHQFVYTFSPKTFSLIILVEKGTSGELGGVISIQGTLGIMKGVGRASLWVF